MNTQSDERGWIKFEDRRPEVKYNGELVNFSNKVLVTDGKRVHTGIRCLIGGRESFHIEAYISEFSSDEMTHWMPLPELPNIDVGEAVECSSDLNPQI